MSDYIVQYSDEQFEALRDRITEIFGQSSKDLEKKLADFIEASEKRDKKKRADLAAGKITEAYYRRWKEGQIFQSKQWKQKLDDITSVYVEADKKAQEILTNTQRDVFVEAANYTAHEIENKFNGAVAFNLFDRKTVERLLKDDPKMLPEWKIDQPKDYVWNERRVQNEVTKGIIQGESISEIGKRLTTELAARNARKMTMFARTAMTGAHNAGRMDRLHEAVGMGIKVKKKWLATLDNRTRDEHGFPSGLEGQEKEIDEPFVINGKEIDYPGDPTCPHPELVYNCRCTLTYVYDVAKSFENLRSMQYQENQRENYGYEITDDSDSVTQTRHYIAQGTDISETWERRPDQFAFEIDDVIDAQGFNGLPRVVDAEEFEKIAKENNFLAQRGYIAPTKETLDAYRDQLYNGEWYVNCSHGGAMYGQGMYAGANFTGEMTDGVKRVSEGYSGNGLGYVETFTMTDAKFVTFTDVQRELNGGLSERDRLNLYSKLTKDEELFLDMNAHAFFPDRQAPDWQKASEAAQRLGEEGRDKVMHKFQETMLMAQERSRALKEKYHDIGVYAASCGYDGIICGRKDEDGVYVVILNRTKCVFRRPD